MNKLVQTPHDHHSRPLFTSLVHKRNSIAQLTFIIAKLSSFILKKNYYKHFPPATTNLPDEINKALPKHVPPSTNLEISTSNVPPSTIFLQQPPPSYVLQTVNPNVCTKLQSNHNF